MNKNAIKSLKNKSLVILGFGTEGQSTFRYLRKLFPEKTIAIADRDETISQRFSDLTNVRWLTGQDYRKQITHYEVIIKSPGIKLTGVSNSKITSQSDLFLKTFGDQVIGVTGTKGKSTTTSLIHHIVRQQTSNTVLVGNIGIPPFEKIDNIDDKTIIVNEISAHQLENTEVAPSTAILLNLFEEHLDRFTDKAAYYYNKLKILQNQHKCQHAVLNDESSMNGDLNTQLEIQGKKWLFGFQKSADRAAWLEHNKIIFRKDKQLEEYAVDKIHLPGRHNLLNIMAAIVACRINQISPEGVIKGLQSFKGLEHRIEKVGTFRHITFYNDSISTIPHATIEALKTLPYTDTLILGGFDRNINYELLYPFLKKSAVSNLIFTGPAGKRISNEFSKVNTDKAVIFENNMESIVKKAYKITAPGKICLLSPAASSYDQFKNFEERGNQFKKWVKKMGTADESLK